MKSLVTAVILVAGLALSSGAALAADCFSDMMSKTNQMISDAQSKSGMEKKVTAAKKMEAQAQQLHDAGKEDEAMVKLVRAMELVKPGGYRSR